jgi:AsmA protein
MPGNRKIRVLKIFGIAAALMIALIIALPFFVDANQFRPVLESELTGALGREVKVGNLKLSLLSGAVAADEVAIADDPAFSRSPFVRAKFLRVGVELKPLLFSKAVYITAITLDQPEVTLIHSPSGEWNFSSIGGKTRGSPRKKQGEGSKGALAADVSISRLRVTNGRVTVIRSGAHPRPRIYDKVDVRASDLSFTSVFPFALAASVPVGGSVKLEGKAGPINRTDASLTPVTANLDVAHLDVVASGFIEPDAGLAGVLDFNGSLASDGRRMQSTGRGRAEKLQMVKGGAPAGLPVTLDYSLNHNLSDQTGTLSEAKVEFGKAAARLNGTYDAHGESTVLKMRLRGENMPADDLQALLPAIGVTLPKGASLQGGTLNADLAVEGPVDKLVASGKVGLVNARLAGFDLGAKIATVASLAGIKPSSVTAIEKFASDLRVAPDGIQASNLVLIAPGVGQLTGNGTVSANHSLDFKMLASLQSSSGVVGGMSSLAGKDLNIPFFIRGTTSDPAFVPDAQGAAASLLESVVSGKEKSGEGGKSLGDTLRDLFKKKKK